MSTPGDVAVLVLGVPAPRRRTGRIALLAGAGVVLASAVGALVFGDRVFAPPPPAVRPAAAVAEVQQFTAASGYALKAPKRDGFTAIDDSPASGGTAPAPLIALGPATPAGTAQVYAAAAVERHGWSSADFSCLVALWNRESHWNTHAGSPGGAYGIPQALPGSKMSAAGGDWVNSAQVQIDWGLAYIAADYGTPCGAWAHSEATGYY